MRKPWLLMIDDCPGDALLMRLAFRRAQIDLEFELAASAEAGLARLVQCVRQNTPLPDVVLCDLNLPKMHGLGLLAVLKSDPDLREIPVIICSSSDSTIDIEGSFAGRADGYITKPMGLQGYDSVIGILARDWLVDYSDQHMTASAINQNDRIWRLTA